MSTAIAIDAVDGQAMHLAVEAMGTRFELVYWGPRAAGEEALAEIAGIDSRLSAYQASSDIAWINAHAGLRAVKVSPRTFTLLQRCLELSEDTHGAFDITVGPLLQAWRFIDSGGSLPSADRIADARTRVGYRHMHLDPRTSTIRFARAGMRLDLGAVQKGYAIDAAMALLAARGLRTALLHAGTNNVHALGEPPQGAWTVVWERPDGRATTIALRDSALSVSFAHRKSFVAEGRRYGHVFDPLIGLPVQHAETAVVTGPNALECDALSTALLVLGEDWLPLLREHFPGYDGDVA